jgi:hypothetical protein
MGLKPRPRKTQGQLVAESRARPRYRRGDVSGGFRPVHIEGEREGRVARYRSVSSWERQGKVPSIASLFFVSFDSHARISADWIYAAVRELSAGTTDVFWNMVRDHLTSKSASVSDRLITILPREYSLGIALRTHNVDRILDIVEALPDDFDIDLPLCDVKLNEHAICLSQIGGLVPTLILLESIEKIRVDPCVRTIARFFPKRPIAGRPRSLGLSDGWPRGYSPSHRLVFLPVRC